MVQRFKLKIQTQVSTDGRAVQSRMLVQDVNDSLYSDDQSIQLAAAPFPINIYQPPSIARQYHATLRIVTDQKTPQFWGALLDPE